MKQRIYCYLLGVLLLCAAAGAQTYAPSPVPKLQFLDSSGRPLAGGKIYSYAAGTSTPLTTYSNGIGTANTNPVILDSGGFADIWLSGASAYLLVAQNAAGVQQWSVDGVTSAAGLASYTAPYTGAAARSVSSKLGDVISARDFGALGDGTTDDAAALQAAVTAASGKRLYIPAGTYKTTATITVPCAANMVIDGAGKSGSIISYTGTGDAIAHLCSINGSHVGNLTIEHLGIVATNASNAGGGLDQVCAANIIFRDVYVSHFKYNVIFDQSEMAYLEDSVLDSSANTVADVWLVNGSQHSPGASAGYTNVIGVINNHINAAATGSTVIGIADDGGYAHRFSGNNFNGGSYGLHVAGVTGEEVSANDFEAGANGAIKLEAKTLDGTSTAGPFGLSIRANSISAGAHAPIQILSYVGSVEINSNLLNGTSYGVTGAVNCQRISLMDNTTGSGGIVLVDGFSAVHFQINNFDNSTGNNAPKIQGFAQLAAVNTYTANSEAFTNGADADMFLAWRAGSTANQNEYAQYKGYDGTTKWTVYGYLPGCWECYAINDAQNNVDRIRMTGYRGTASDGWTYVNSAAAAPMNFNLLPNSGTGGFLFGSGGASPTQVAKIDASGNMFAGNGTTTIYRCTTAGALPVGALTTATGNCGASTDTGMRGK